MRISRTISILLLILRFFVEVNNLEVVPLEKNVILNTEYLIRNVTNDIFLKLRLKGIKNNKKLQQHNLIHNFFTKLGVADQHTLAVVNTVSRFDKADINNTTLSFMDILNELLEEDWINDEDNSLTGNINVLKFINNYLSGESYKLKQDDFSEVMEMLKSELTEQNLVESSDEDNNFEKSNNTETGNEFWKPGPMGRRIYQSKKTKIKTYPFMASIHIFHSFQCGGTIIKSDLILTAASCLQLAYNNRFFRENPAFLSVRVGTEFYQGGGDVIEALEVYFEPNYDPKTLKHNLAIIRLLKHINFKKRSHVKKIEIDRKAHNLPYNAGPVTIVGWGARTSTNIMGNPWINRLSYAHLGTYHFRDCEEIYTKEFVTHTNFCAGSAAKGSGACNKDAGDPGVIGGIQVGVASFGAPTCGTPDAPTVFTKVGFYADWIDGIMEQRVPTRNKITTTKMPYRPHTPDLQKEFRQLTTFSFTPVVDTKSPILTNEIEPPEILRDKNKPQDEELMDLLYNMIGDKNTDPDTMRDKIQKMIPEIKHYATTPKPITTEEFISTDIEHQQHTVIDKTIYEDVDLNIAKMIDKLDGETYKDFVQGEVLKVSHKKNGKGKKIAPSKAPELIDIPDVGDMGEGGSMNSLRELTKRPGVTEAFGSYNPIDDGLNDGEGSARMKEAKTKHKPKKEKRVLLEDKKQILTKIRNTKKGFERVKLPERQNVNKEKLQKEIIYIDEEDELGTKKKRKPQKINNDVQKNKRKPQPMKINTTPVDDAGMGLDDVLNGVFGDELGANLGDLDKDGTSAGDGSAAVINDRLIEGYPVNIGKIKQNNRGVIKPQNKKRIDHYDEFDNLQGTIKSPNKINKKNGIKKDTEEVLTLLYLSSDEKQTGMIRNKVYVEEKNPQKFEPKPNLLDYNDANDGLDDADDEFSLPQNNATKTLYENLPKDQLYELLTEAIDDLTSKKRKNSK